MAEELVTTRIGVTRQKTLKIEFLNKWWQIHLTRATSHKKYMYGANMTRRSVDFEIGRR